MKKQFRWMMQAAGVLAMMAGGAGPGFAAEADAVPLVKPSERSSHFAAVQKQLELGGTLYAYADVDGDVLKLADSLRAIMEQVAGTQPEAAPFLKQDYRSIFTLLGFDDIKAFGLSSVPEDDGMFRNRVFLLTPQGRHGLLAGLGGPPAPFNLVKLAPAGTDLYSEAELDFAQVYQTLKAVVTKVGGETSANLMEAKLKEASQKSDIDLLKLINDFKGRSVLVLRLDPKNTLTVPGFVLPLPSFLLGIEGIAPALEPLLKKTKSLKLTQEKGRKIYSSAQALPILGVAPVIAIEGTTLYLATTSAFLNECMDHKAGLDQTDEFRDAMRHVNATGNSLTYASPGLFARLHDLERLNPEMTPQTAQTLRLVLQNLPQPKQPLVTVRTNLPEGILVQAHLNRSLKQDVAMLAVYNPATVGLMAAMAIPAFQKVRTSSQEKAVLNNLRQLAAASDQYYLEHNVDTVTLDKLVGPETYIKQLTPVAGEDYSELVFKQGEPLVVHLPDGREVRYAP